MGSKAQKYLNENEENMGDKEEERKEEIKIIKRRNNLLSFSDSESESDEEPQIKKRKLMKNPNVDTSFLPDPERDAEDEKLRKELEIEWRSKQQNIKREKLLLCFAYFDGSGHRRSIQIVKGMQIGNFLEFARKELFSQFCELRGIKGDNLLYIKDDFIIPHTMLFYDLIVTAAKGKSGHLMFKNRKGADIECGHPGKVITRSWYEKNKHIFPASNWEIYDPSVVEAAKDEKKLSKRRKQPAVSAKDMKVGNTKIDQAYMYKQVRDIHPHDVP